MLETAMEKINEALLQRLRIVQTAEEKWKFLSDLTKEELQAKSFPKAEAPSTPLTKEELGSALEKMFRIGQGSSQGGEGGGGLSLKDVIHGSDYALTYQDEDGDWMLAGDFPWEMFTNTCKRLRITKGSVAFGLGPALCLGHLVSCLGHQIYEGMASSKNIHITD